MPTEARSTTSAATAAGPSSHAAVPAAGKPQIRALHQAGAPLCGAGLAGEQADLELRLKLLADVGIVGAPNAGKSSLLARLTRARPKVGDYPFTTLEPALGTLERPEGRQLVLADIPGLIEGAAQGAGLGHEFLAHVERTRLLVHLVEVAPADGARPLGRLPGGSPASSSSTARDSSSGRRWCC